MARKKSKPTKSHAFATIKRALLALVSDIPAGKVAQVGDIGHPLNIPCRHVAYILSQLTPDEAAMVAWHRVVPTNGAFPKPEKQTARQILQVLMLTGDGIAFDGVEKIASMDTHLTKLSDKHVMTIWADED